MSIHKDCEGGHYDAVKNELDSTNGRAAILEEKSTIFGDTPLLSATHAGQADVVQLLLDYGADVNAQDSQGNTALHLVAKRDDVQCAQVLLGAAKIRLDLTNNVCRTPYVVAKKSQSVKRLIKSAEIVHAARDQAKGLEEMLEQLHEEETTPTCFTEALVATVTQDNAKTANTIICSVAKKIQQDPAKHFHELDLEQCVKASLQNGCTKLSAAVFVCLLVSLDRQRDICYFFHYHDDIYCNDLVSKLVPPTLDVGSVIQEFRTHCNDLKICDLRGPINLAIACGRMEAAKVLLWHDCCKPRSTVLWCQLGLTTVDSSWVKDTESIDFYGKLERLDLRDNKLRNLAPEIFQLPLLNTLLLNKNELSELPKVHRWTSSLVTLYLCENHLESLPDCLGTSEIRNLKIRSNRFSEIPLCICNLVNLESLDFRDNPKITALPLPMGKLLKLKYLQFDEKKITYPVDWEKHRGSVHELIDWLKQKLRQSQSDRRMKLMVTGWNGKGKTTLVRRLQKDLNYDEEKATAGIEISKVPITKRTRKGLLTKLEEPILFQVWDFAGHDAFYATHVCFLSAFALYLLVWNLTDGLQGISDLSTWLDMITARAFTRHARTLPLIIVGTHLDLVPKEDREEHVRKMRADIDRLFKERDDPDLFIKVVEVSCARGSIEGIDVLEKTICDIAGEMLKSTQEAPVRVLEERIPRVYLTLIDKIKEMRAQLKENNKPPIMTEHQLKEDIRSAIGGHQHPNDFAEATLYLQERGVILHYEDTGGMLSDLYFIDPFWLCDLMAKVITVKVLGLVNSDGILKTSDLPLLLKDERFPVESYPSFIELLTRFQLSFPLSKDRVLVPSKLPEEKPKEARTDDAECELIKRIYRLPNLPYGFCSRLIARLLYHLSDMLEEAMRVDEGIKSRRTRESPYGVSALMGKELLCWRSGIYFRQASMLFEVGFSSLPSGGREIQILVSSNESGKCVLNLVVDHIETLISEWFSGMKKIKRLVPCSACEKANQEPHEFSLDEYHEGDDVAGVDGGVGAGIDGGVGTVGVGAVGVGAVGVGAVGVGAVGVGAVVVGAVGVGAVGVGAVGVGAVGVGAVGVGAVGVGAVGVGAVGVGAVGAGNDENTKGAHFKCAKQDAILPLHQLAPDLTFQDIEPHLIIPDGQLQYDKEYVLGKGSSGTVYCGRHGNKRAAIKEFKKKSYREVRKEVDVLRRVTCHPNFVSLFGVSRKPLCIAMELESKGSLESVLFNTPALKIPRLVRMAMACQVSDALSLLHRLGIVYRDLRPANILVHSLSETDRVHVKLSDFGTAAFVGPGGLKNPVGPTRICAPEMLEFISMEKYDTKVDIFSLGVLFYSLITRKLAFHELQDSAKIKQWVLKSKRPPWKDDPASMYSFVNLSRVTCLCWGPTAADRPTAAQVREQLAKPVFQALMGKFALSRNQTLQCIRYFPGARQMWIAFQEDAKTLVSVFLVDEQKLQQPCVVYEDSSSFMLSFMCPLGDLVMLVFENAERQLLLKPCPLGNPEYAGDDVIHLQCGALNDVIVRGNDVSGYTLVIPEEEGETAQGSDVTIPDRPNSRGITIGGHDVITSSEKGCLLLSSGDSSRTLRCLTSEACSAVSAGAELWLGVQDSITVSSSRPEPSVTVVSELPSEKTSLATDGQNVWSLRDDILIKWSCETKRSLLSVNCASHLQAVVPGMPVFGHVTCFAPAQDTVWLGSESGHIIICDASSGEVLAWFHPYNTEVKSLTLCTDAEPPRIVSCGAELDGVGLGMSDVTCAVERGELLVPEKPCKGGSDRNSSKRTKARPYTWEPVDQELGHVLLMWHSLPAHAFVDNH